MAPLTYKPQPKMHSWTPPSPPKPKRSKFFLWAVLGWLLATAGGYYWPWGERDRAEEPTAEMRSLEPTRLSPRVPVQERPLESRPSSPQRPPSSNVEPTTHPSKGEVRPCEEFIQQATEATDNRLPMHLGRSAIDVFIGENDWAKPCRSGHRRTVALCVAIRDGAVVGLTARTSPPNLTLENCLREQAAMLSLQQESTVRVVRTTLAL
jgi:hypothetical protein